MKLFTRTKIGNMTLKNRIIMCPMGNKTDPDGGVQERNIDYFEERAKGGCAAIFTGAFMCTEEFETRGCNVLYNFSHVDRLNLLVDKVHAHDCKLVVQLTAGLGRMGYTDPTRPPYSASDTETFYFKGVYCKPFTVEQIRYMVKAMGNSAMLAKRAGADAVELHCYGGYLIDQFQTALWNHRTDEYGGSLENRMRFTMEIIKEVQKTCGPDFPIIVKFCVTHDMGDAPGYHDMAEGLEMAKMYEAAGVAALHVDVGCYDAWYKAITTCYNKEGHQLFAARAVKKAVSIPVITQGKLFDPVKAEAVLEDGDADIVGLGHQMLTDPYWPQKVKEGRYYDIVPCIGCNECMYTSRNGQYRHCAVNPLCYHEKDYPLIPAETPKKVLVIGGGPGGMEAAITAAGRGHKVTLVEKSDKLGGNLHPAGAPYFKEDIRKLCHVLTRRVEQAGVTVVMNTEATPKYVRDFEPDALIVAVGSSELRPPIPGIDGENVVMAIEAELHPERLGKRVAIMGGGLVGAEAACSFFHEGHQVSIVEMKDDIAMEVNSFYRGGLMPHVQESADIYVKTKVKAITPEGILAENAEGEFLIEADTIVCALGFRAPWAAVDALCAEVDESYVVGDCKNVGQIYHAMNDGYYTGLLL